MGFSLALIVIAILLVGIYAVIHGIKNKNWKQVCIAIAAIIVFVAGLGYGLIYFITSM